MAKILFLNIPTHGHVNPTLALVKELVDRGNEVVYYVNEPFIGKVEAVGAEVRKGIVFPSGISSVMNDPEMAVERTLNLLRHMLDFSKNLINSKEKFDCMIYDNVYFVAKEIGKRLNIKTICSHSTFALNKEMLQEGLKGRLMNDETIAKFKENEEVKAILNEYKEVLGIDLSGILEFNFGNSKPNLNLVYTSRMLQPKADSFNETYKFVGPSITERKEDQTINTDFGKDEKLVYISLGTIFNESLDFYLACFEAFKNTECKFIMSVGKNTDIKALGPIPENFVVFNYVPQLEVLSKADIFITHGGMNSSSEGLYFGLPLIMIPQGVDQPMVARQIEKRGACIVLDKNNITPQLLKTSLDEIIKDDSYKNNAMKIRENFMECGGHKQAADIVMDLIGEKVNL